MKISKKLRSLAVMSLIGMQVLSTGIVSFANDTNERVIPKGEGEIPISIPETYALEGSPYVSSISMGDRIAEGATRRYYLGVPTIKMTVKTRGDADGNNKCRVRLERRTAGSSTNLGSRDLNLVRKGSTYTATYPKQNGGNFRFVFDNRASLFGWSNIDYFVADPVKMYSK